jgi:large subunit ribosomal protein L18
MSEYQRKRTQRKERRHKRAHLRIRRRVRGTAERPRLAVNRSLKYVYAQLIDDDLGTTLAHASSSETAVREGLESSTASKAAARKVGKLLADRAKEKGVEKVVFDRGGYIFHGKIKEVADGARENGLKF